MMLHATLFWFLVFLSIYKILGKFDVEWATLFQWWWWNLFAYLYVAFMHFIAVNKKKFQKNTNPVPSTQPDDNSSVPTTKA